MWYIKKWADLTPQQIYEIMIVRNRVFVVEQKRLYNEVDKEDLRALHVFKMRAGKVIAYARVFPITDKKVSFGRVVTSPEMRGEGYGWKLLQKIMAVIKDYFPSREIEIEAQEQVQGFYRKMDFQSVGDVFLFHQTPHIKMVHPALTQSEQILSRDHNKKGT